MAKLTVEQMFEFSTMLVDYGLKWHKAQVAWDTPEMTKKFKEENDQAAKIFEFIEKL